MRPAYRLYRAAEMLRQQGCNELADQYDAAGDQLAQQNALVGLGGLKGWEKDAASPAEARLSIGNLRFGPGGGGTVNYLRGELSYKTPLTPELTKLVNPQNGGTNCRACAVAVDRLLADGAPSSAPANLGRGSDAAITNLYGGKPFLSSALSGIVRDIGAGGDGARGIVWGYGPGKEGSHVFNVVSVKGGVILLDGQSGHAAPAAYRRYALLRTDK